MKYDCFSRWPMSLMEKESIKKSKTFGREGCHHLPRHADHCPQPYLSICKLIFSFYIHVLFQENMMTSVRKVDCALLPPSAKTVHNKLLRAHFISILLGSADSPHPEQGLDPLNFGWKEKNGYYVPEWFVGPLSQIIFSKKRSKTKAVWRIFSATYQMQTL